jgi:hypothetical protein
LGSSLLSALSLLDPMSQLSQHFFIFSFYDLFSVLSLQPSNNEMPPGGSLKVTDKK